MSSKKKIETVKAECPDCKEFKECVVTGGGPVCWECIDATDAADWEPVDAAR